MKKLKGLLAVSKTKSAAICFFQNWLRIEKQEMAHEEEINWPNESDRFDYEQIGGMSFVSEHINLFFPWTDSSPTLITIYASETQHS